MLIRINPVTHEHQQEAETELQLRADSAVLTVMDATATGLRATSRRRQGQKENFFFKKRSPVTPHGPLESIQHPPLAFIATSICY